MTKRFGFILVALLILSALLAACGSSESRDNAESYFKDVLNGDVPGAQDKACDSFKDQAAQFAADFGALDVQDIDIQFDEGKGGNQEEIIVTGSFDLGTGDDADEIELAQTFRDDDGEDYHTRVVLEMREEDGDWCVKDIEWNDLPVILAMHTGEAVTTEEPTEVETEPVATEEPTTDEVEPVATDEAAPAEETDEEATPAATDEAAE